MKAPSMRDHVIAPSVRFALVLALALASCGDPAEESGHGATAAGSAAPGAPAVSGNGGALAAGTSGVGVSGGLGAGAAGALGTAGSGTGGATSGGGATGAGGTAAAGGAMNAGAGAAGGSTGSAGEGPEVGTVEDSGASCPIPDLPAPDQLSAFATHHDPFTMLDGTRITTRAEWRCRRAEIKAQVERYESGAKPVVAREDVSAQLSGSTLSITVSASGESIRFSVNISRPADAPAESIPVLIAYGGNTLDRTVFSQNGVATIAFDINAMGAQSGAGSRGTGLFYDLYGRDHPASSMVAWAWGVSRILDALEQTPEANLDPRRVAVTGCSRNGKGALLAGALDERIALTLPQESGAGGSASWRVSQAQSEMGENVQTLSSAAGEQPWFRADFGQNFGGSNVTRLPFDHHMVMGLVAPRALLVIDNQIDWLGIDSTYTAGSIAHAIWEAFGLGDHMGYWQTGGHAHCQFPAEQRDILDAYVKKFLVGTGTDDTTMLRAASANADLDRWMEWTPPTLQ
jgi:hypothetical protein